MRPEESQLNYTLFENAILILFVLIKLKKTQIQNSLAIPKSQSFTILEETEIERQVP